MGMSEELPTAAQRSTAFDARGGHGSQLQRGQRWQSGALGRRQAAWCCAPSTPLESRRNFNMAHRSSLNAGFCARATLVCGSSQHYWRLCVAAVLRQVDGPKSREHPVRASCAVQTCTAPLNCLDRMTMRGSSADGGCRLEGRDIQREGEPRIQRAQLGASHLLRQGPAHARSASTSAWPNTEKSVSMPSKATSSTVPWCCAQPQLRGTIWRQALTIAWVQRKWTTCLNGHGPG